MKHNRLGWRLTQGMAGPLLQSPALLLMIVVPVSSYPLTLG
jgi:hypothetical protein